MPKVPIYKIYFFFFFLYIVLENNIEKTVVRDLGTATVESMSI